MNLFKTLLVAPSLCAALVYATAASATPTPAVSFTSSAPASTNGPVSVGFFFFSTADIEVTDLGAFDLGGDGFLNDHEVGIFDIGDNFGALLVSATVASSDALDGGFRYTSITPFPLEANHGYVVAAGDYDGSGQDTFVVASDLMTAPQIVYGQSAISSMHSGLTFPTFTNGPNGGDFGGSFRYQLAGANGGPGPGPVVTPEPGSLGLFALSLVAVLALGCRRSQSWRGRPRGS